MLTADQIETMVISMSQLPWLNATEQEASDAAEASLAAMRQPVTLEALSATEGWSGGEDDTMIRQISPDYYIEVWFADNGGNPGVTLYHTLRWKDEMVVPNATTMQDLADIERLFGGAGKE